MYWPIGAPHAFTLVGRELGLNREPSPKSTDDAAAFPQQHATYSPNLKEEDHGNPSGEDAPDSSQDNGIGNQTFPSDSDEYPSPEILAVRASRGGDVFAAITATCLTVLQTKPTVPVTSFQRSQHSIDCHGKNKALFWRSNSSTIVVQTDSDHLIAYSVIADPSTRVYRTDMEDGDRNGRYELREAYNLSRKAPLSTVDSGPGEANGVRELHLRYQSVIKIDAEITSILALDVGLVLATDKSAAMRSISWAEILRGSSGSSQSLADVKWLEDDSLVVDMAHERSMNLTCWLTNKGCAYVVQDSHLSPADELASETVRKNHCFRRPGKDFTPATHITINARFSLIAIGCQSGSIEIFTVKDYLGNIPLSHQLRLDVGSSTTGQLCFLGYSPDGYCLFAGFEHGWAMWSTYGKPGTTSFNRDKSLAEIHRDMWLLGVRDAFWIGNGCELAIVAPNDNRLWIINLARHAAVSNMNSANLLRGLLMTNDSVLSYQGHGESDLTAVSTETNLWHTVQIPSAYLARQWPLRCASVSDDGKYIAVAGTRGLAHYSVASGRWKTFDDIAAEQEFGIRGGMCWRQHFLIAAIHTGSKAQLRIYSREKTLGSSTAMYIEELAGSVISMSISGSDSLLVYTSDNTLQHYIFAHEGNSAIRLVMVGQIGFQGIIRSPARVRSISWILPDSQIEFGDPSQDIVTASILFLIDAKLVLLQPSTNEQGELKYDMRVLAGKVEYFVLLRDQPSILSPGKSIAEKTALAEPSITGSLGHSLRDSLWYFDGDALLVWSDVQDVLSRAPIESGRDLNPAAGVSVDFYPIAVLVAQGIVHGWDVDLVERKDLCFGLLRPTSCTQLFLPKLMHHHLAEYDAPTALHLASSYQHLPYFPHALEVLLHNVLDKEVDEPPVPAETALLPAVISFLSSFAAFLDVVVNCTRKTELRSWRTLFAHLPPALELFEESLRQGRLKTAAGYLLVLHAFESADYQVEEFSQLLRAATVQSDWELARELARFLVGIDPSGRTLQAVMERSGIVSIATNGRSTQPAIGASPQDYFSLGRENAPRRTMMGPRAE